MKNEMNHALFIVIEKKKTSIFHFSQIIAFVPY